MKKKYKINFITYPIGDATFTQFCNYIEIGHKTRESLNKVNIGLKDSKNSSRILNFWEKEGIINDNRKDGKGWRKYSIMDKVWIEIIKELRDFGYPLEKIRKTKESLDRTEKREDTEGNVEEFRMFDFFVALALSSKEYPILLIVFPDGEALVTTHSDYARLLYLHNFKSHIHIKLNDILQKIFPKNTKLATGYPLQWKLSEDEKATILSIRHNEYESIELKMKDGKVERIEGTQTVKSKERIIDILNDENYQDIEIKQRNGDIVCIKRKIMQKVIKE